MENGFTFIFKTYDTIRTIEIQREANYDKIKKVTSCVVL